GAFDTLDWIDPPADAEASANAAAMLPLLVGLVGDQNGTDPVADDNDRSDVVDVEATADADEAEATTADAESPAQKDKAEPA
ncbi:MAG: heme biosynthesis protein HemY, partial [Pseudomonadota bacterium]